MLTFCDSLPAVGEGHLPKRTLAGGSFEGAIQDIEPVADQKGVLGDPVELAQMRAVAAGTRLTVAPRSLDRETPRQAEWGEDALPRSANVEEKP